MAVTIRDGFLPRSVMLLCLGAGFALLVVQWYGWSNPRPPASRDGAVLTPASVPAQPVVKATALTLNPLKSLSQLLQLRPSAPFNTGAPSARATLAMPLTTQVVVRLSQKRVFVYEGGRIVAHYPLAVGQKGWETPIGSFQVLHMWKNPRWKHPITGQVFPPGSDNPLGSRWIGFWSDGHTEIGFHGTNQEDLIGQAVSHGCLRMYNRDVEALYQKVAQGTPITIQQ